MNIKRFSWVCAPLSKIMHIKYDGTVEGPTKCGAWAAPGWRYSFAAYWRRRKDHRACKRCCA